MIASFDLFLRRVRRRLRLRRAFAEAVRVLAVWTAAAVVLLAAGRLGLGVPALVAAGVLAAAGLAHAGLRAARACPTEREAGIWIDRRLGLPELAATAVELLRDPEPGPFREPLVQRAHAEAWPRRDELLTLGPPPPALDLLVGAAVIAAALALLPGGRAAEAPRPGAHGSASAAAAAGAALDERALLLARLEAAQEARERGESEATLAARIAQLEQATALPGVERAHDPQAPEPDLDARLAALAQRLGSPPDAGETPSGSGSAAEDGTTAEPPETAALRALDAPDKQAALRGRPDWPRERDAVVERYFGR